MSGGQLVVLDRAGRDMKRFPLAEGLATLGSDPACDIRIMLPTVSPHHATVVVHANQTVVRNVCSDDTQVNGRCVSVAALRHGDVIGIGGRQLRWEYAEPAARRPQAPEPALYVSRRKGRGVRRGSGPAGASARDPQVQLALEMSHRASMPGSAGGKQVAIVQPQRRDTSDQIDKNPQRTPLLANKRPRTSKSDLETSVSEAEQETTKRKSTARVSPKNSLSNLQTTKATLWIESRKTSPRKSNKIQTPTQEQVLRARRTTASAKKSTPLRLTVLKRAQSAHKMRVTKIEGPLTMDHTKQAAIRLMTGHTPKSKPSSPSFVVKKPSPVRRTPRSRNSRATPRNSHATPRNSHATPGNSRAAPGKSRATLGNSRATLCNSRATPGNSRAAPGNSRATLGNSRATPGNSRGTPGNTSNRRSGADRTVTILEITDSDGQNSSLRNSTASRRSGQKSPKKSFGSTSPRKSALKDPSAKRGARKTESIKFDLSNLENHSQGTDVLMLSDTTRQSYASDDDVTLRYSESSVQSPSPRRSIHSRSRRMLEQTLGTVSDSPPPRRSIQSRSSRMLEQTVGASSESPPACPRPKRSSRGSLIVQKVLNDTDTLSYSRRTTKSVDNSQNATVSTAFRTRTLSPRTSGNDLESYSIVDLVSIDTDESALSTSVYGSVGSTASLAFGTPQDSTGRITSSTIAPTLLGSSTPNVKGRLSTPRSHAKNSMNGTQFTVRCSRSTRSKSLSTPENTEDAKKHISVNSTRVSRASRSRSRLNDSELLMLDEDDDSPRTSKRITTTLKSGRLSAQTAGNDTDVTPTHSPAQADGTCTPENRHSPEEASTPVLSIQSLLDSSQSSFASQGPTRKGRPSFNTNSKIIAGVTRPKTRIGAKSKSLSLSARQTRLRVSSDSVEILNKNDDSEIVTPKSAVKLVPEGVKNKHSTAKKPQSKRSIIDDLNESDIVKQLFNSPVKRKLSQSMTEFSRKQLFDDDDFVRTKRPTRNTITLTGRTPDNSLLDHTESYTPEIFVSPISTPTRSPSLDGIKLMFAKTTPENDLRNVRGVKNLLRTPRTRRSIKNDLTNVSGVKNLFAKSPKNRLSDVRVKEVFASSPNNDLKRVTGVKSLFRTTSKRKSPRNELDDLRGVKKLFNTRSRANDLRNVSGVKRTLRRQSPRNDLSDVRGLKPVFRREKRNDLSYVSGVEELFNLSNYSSATVSTRAESLFDQLVGKPQIRAVYSKSFSLKTVQKTKSPRAKSLHTSLDQITVTGNNWLEQELNKRLQIRNYLDSLKSANTSKANRSKANKSKPMHASLDEVTDVDVLLEQELNKEQQINKYLESMRSVNESKVNKSKVNKSKANRSRFNKSKAHTSKANMSRELQKLITETVEGDAPFRTSRVRNSTIIRNESDVDRKKSASELYSAHTLPIKKRSLVDASEKALLPLKKRAVVHSTPVKGRLHVAMNASVLARVSPIRADETRYTEHDTSITSSQPKETTEVRPKSMRGTRANREDLETANTPEFVKPSPKKTRGRVKVVSPKVKPASPAREKAAAKAKKASPTKTTKASPAKAKKASPAKAKKASPTNLKKSNPTKKLVSPVPAKTTRSRRKHVSTLVKRRSTLVVAKKSPVMSPKPRATRKRKEPETPSTPKPSPKKPRATHKNISVKDDKKTLAMLKNTSVKDDKKTLATRKNTSVKDDKKTRATRKNTSVKDVKKTRAMSKNTSVKDDKKTRATRKNTSVKDDKLKTPKNTRAKVLKATAVVSKPSPQLKPRARRGLTDQTEQETTRNTRKTVTVQDKQPQSPKKSQVQRKSSSKTRAAKVQTKTEGRKTVLSEFTENAVVEKAKAQTKKERNTDEPANKKTRSNRQEKSVEKVKPVRTRGKKVKTQESAESVPSTRGRRAVKTDSIAPEVKTRKRKSDTAPDNEIPPKVRKSKEVAERGRKRATVVDTETKNTQKKSAVKESKEEKVSEAPVKVTRGRNTAEVEPVKVSEAPVKVTRGRKTAEVEPVKVSEAPVKVTRGRKTAEVEPVKVSAAPVKVTRGRKTVEVESVKTTKQIEEKTRGRKANIENVPANQVTGKRKKTAAAEPSPVKERTTRATRGNTQPEDKPAGRSRRR